MFGNIYDVLGESLDVLSDRQNIIASNVANANTPGYKAKELDFRKVMEEMVPSGNSIPMETDSDKDLSSQAGYGRAGDQSGYINSFVTNAKDPSVPALDGNTVDLGTEMSDMTSNAIRYQAVAALLTKKFAELNYAATEAMP